MEKCEKSIKNPSTIPVCVQCRRELNYGDDVIQVTRGVMGHRGFVPLDDSELVCGMRCLRQYGRRDIDGQTDERLGFLKRAA